ncbi:MAG: hypothetical protein OQK99_11460 [Gammaproteobacteria bacterium]|nr:hypothetical protein [Gammaproteobacteria bacterium]
MIQTHASLQSAYKLILLRITPWVKPGWQTAIGQTRTPFPDVTLGIVDLVSVGRLGI